MPLDARALTTMLFRLAPDAKRVRLGAQHTMGVLNDDKQLGVDAMGQPVPIHDRTVFVTAGALSGVVDGVTLTVGGVPYTVRGRPMPRENGDVWAIALAKLDA
jgi:hypothetical protein